MGIFSNLFKIGQAKVREIDETVEEQNAVILSEQEIVDDEKAIAAARNELRNLKVSAKIDEDKIAEINAEIEQYTALGHKAQEEGNDENLELIVEKLTKLENDLAPIQQRNDSNQANIKTVESRIATAEDELRAKKDSLDAFKANEAALKAQERTATAMKGLGKSSTSNALERAKARQERRQKSLDVIQEEADNKTDLDSRLARAGLGGGKAATTSSDVMARFKK